MFPSSLDPNTHLLTYWNCFFLSQPIRYIQSCFPFPWHCYLHLLTNRKCSFFTHSQSYAAMLPSSWHLRTHRNCSFTHHGGPCLREVLVSLLPHHLEAGKLLGQGGQDTVLGRPGTNSFHSVGRYGTGTATGTVSWTTIWLLVILRNVAKPVWSRPKSLSVLAKKIL